VRRQDSDQKTAEGGCDGVLHDGGVGVAGIDQWGRRNRSVVGGRRTVNRENREVIE